MSRRDHRPTGPEQEELTSSMRSLSLGPLSSHHPDNGSRARRELQSSTIPQPEAFSLEEIKNIKRTYPLAQYPQLYFERLRSKPHVGAPFPFMKLPPELRLEVYRYRLVQQSPIELWPHVIDNVRWRSNIKRQKAFRRYESLYPTLGLLRVSRLINEEASQVFYGENEFRFSGINGWMVFSAFLNTIGPSHYRFLAHVTIHVPFPGQEYLAIPSFGRTGFQERVCRHKLSQKRGFHCRLLQYGLKVPPNWNYDSSIQDCIAKLSKSTLKTFRLVLPPTYYINSQSHNKRMTRYWKMLIRFKRDIDTARALEASIPLKFDFIFLKLKDSFVDLAEDDFDREFRPWLVRYTGQVKRIFDQVKAADWIDSVLYGVYDYNGSYAVMDRESCERITGPRAFENEQHYEESWMDKL